MNTITATHTLASAQAATPADFGDQLEAAAATHAQANGANGPGDPIKIKMDDGSIWEIEFRIGIDGQPAYRIGITAPDGSYGGSIYYAPGKTLRIHESKQPGGSYISQEFDLIRGRHKTDYNWTERRGDGTLDRFERLDEKKLHGEPLQLHKIKTAINQADAERMMQEHEMQPDTIPADTIPVS